MLAMRLRALALLGALLFVALTAAPAAPLAAQPGKPALRAYLLRGGSPADAAAAAALVEAGLRVDVGVETPDFTGAEANLRSYDLVVVLYNNNVSRPIGAAGAAALAGYVQSGGGLLSAELLAAQSAELGLSELAGLLPAETCGLNGAGSTTFTRTAPNPVIDAGVPVAFSVTLANPSGSEGCLRPRPEAMVLYGSSNGGGQAGGAAGLVAWNPPGTQGRVASFSTLLSTGELANPSMRRLVQNTALWVAGGRDLTAPTIQQYTLSRAGTLSASRDITVEVRANDRGGSRLGSIYLAEYVYSGDQDDPWLVANSSGWLPWGNGANRTIAWQLMPDPGVHYVQIFVADRAGNVSSTPGLDYISYQPPSVDVADGQQRIYRLRPAAGSQVRVRMEALSGNPDLYIFSVDDERLLFAPESNLPVEQLDFTADGGDYQIEVEGHIAGSYRLSAGPPTPDEVALLMPAPRARPRTSIITLRAVAPEDADLPPAPAEEGPAASVGRIIYLSQLQR